jgi:uncharacterized membrane protein
MTATPDDSSSRPGMMGRLRNYLLTGLLVLAPSAVTIYVFFRLLNWMDNILGRYFRFAALDYHRIPGLGLLATLLLLVIVGWMASWIGARPMLNLWDKVLTRIPGVGILYGSTKSLGEAFFSQKQQVFKRVVLVPWPHEGMWRVGFVTGLAGADVATRPEHELEAACRPHTPNPASELVQHGPRSSTVYPDLPVEEGLKVVISGGVVQPGNGAPVARAATTTAQE